MKVILGITEFSKAKQWKQDILEEDYVFAYIKIKALWNDYELNSRLFYCAGLLKCSISSIYLKHDDCYA